MAIIRDEISEKVRDPMKMYKVRGTLIKSKERGNRQRLHIYIMMFRNSSEYLHRGGIYTTSSERPLILY